MESSYLSSELTYRIPIPKLFPFLGEFKGCYKHFGKVSITMPSSFLIIVIDNNPTILTVDNVNYYTGNNIFKVSQTLGNIYMGEKYHFIHNIPKLVYRKVGLEEYADYCKTTTFTKNIYKLKQVENDLCLATELISRIKTEIVSNITVRFEKKGNKHYKNEEDIGTNDTLTSYILRDEFKSMYGDHEGMRNAVLQHGFGLSEKFSKKKERLRSINRVELECCYKLTLIHIIKQLEDYITYLKTCEDLLKDSIDDSSDDNIPYHNVVPNMIERLNADSILEYTDLSPNGRVMYVEGFLIKLYSLSLFTEYGICNSYSVNERICILKENSNKWHIYPLANRKSITTEEAILSVNKYFRLIKEYARGEIVNMPTGVTSEQ